MGRTSMKYYRDQGFTYLSIPISNIHTNTPSFHQIPISNTHTNTPLPSNYHHNNKHRLQWRTLPRSIPIHNRRTPYPSSPKPCHRRNRIHRPHGPTLPRHSLPSHRRSPGHHHPLRNRPQQYAVPHCLFNTLLRL